MERKYRFRIIVDYFGDEKPVKYSIDVYLENEKLDEFVLKAKDIVKSALHQGKNISFDYRDDKRVLRTININTYNFKSIRLEID